MATKNKQQWVVVDMSKFTLIRKVDDFLKSPWKFCGWHFLVYIFYFILGQGWCPFGMGQTIDIL